ncbi:N-formylglutamate amidohydrolase, partial [Streptomyces rhizosphaericola]
MSPGPQPSFRLHPGSPDSPVLLHVPHGSRTVPDDVRGEIVLADSALERELDHITDAHTAELAARTAGSA